MSSLVDKLALGIALAACCRSSGQGLVVDAHWRGVHHLGAVGSLAGRRYEPVEAVHSEALERGLGIARCRAKEGSRVGVWTFARSIPVTLTMERRSPLLSDA